MHVADKVIVVTGGASGIGRALCQRFAHQRAKVVADEIDGLDIKCDVRKEEEIIKVVRQTEEKIGPIDMFCSNASIMLEGGEEVPNEGWQGIWEINVLAHVYAARAVIPGMIKRGGGYLLNSASAAGLLTQIGSAPYSVTKHAAVGLAENIAISDSPD